MIVFAASDSGSNPGGNEIFFRFMLWMSVFDSYLVRKSEELNEWIAKPVAALGAGTK